MLSIFVITAIGTALIAGTLRNNLRIAEQEQELELKQIEYQQTLEENKVKEVNLNACLVQVEEDAWDMWKLNCSSEFEYDSNDEIVACSVAINLAENLDKTEQDRREDCIEMYKY